MCGIAGVVYADDRRPSTALLAEMGQRIAHRGPDGQGVQVFEGAGFVHRRLAIIDLSPEAAQPMVSHDGGAWVVFNGEIYNFLELRKELEALGDVFKTRGDTEVILAAFRRWGPHAIERLDGMFAIALWEPSTRTLTLARDRTGKKPLYVYEDGERVVFASEVKAILAHPGLDTRMWPEAVTQFLSHGYVPTPRTFWARIRKVFPATVEVFQRGKAPVARQYWDFSLERARDVSLPEAKERVRSLFFAAVKKRLMSDVPLGAFLSGGIDSTLIVAAMARESSAKVKTFSIGFEGHPQWDETAYARLVAERYETEHTEFKVKPESFELIEKLAWHYDEPFGDSSAIPTAIVSRLTRQKVTVALTGDGGDEVFCGYPRFAAALGAEFIPRPLRSLARTVLEPLPAGERHGSPWEKARRFALHASQPLPDRLRNWVSLFNARELKELLVPEYAAYATAPVLGDSYARLDAKTKQLDVLNRVLYLNARTYLLDDLNVKMDRASMAASLETRAPFLDTALMDFASTLGGPFKLHGTTFKWILKQALGDLIPEPILTRKKMGFGVPLGAWFRDELKDVIRDRLLGEGAQLHAFIRRDALEGLLAAHEAKRRDLGLHFWSLWMLESWLRAHPH
ncbi:MAG: asparagine synthase (glutamine-hydrolyzing) [Myxococcaceae bacterium]